MRKFGLTAIAILASACATQPGTPSVAPLAPPVAAAARTSSGVAPQYQYLYGSAEAATLSRMSWNTLIDYVERRIAAGRPANSVVLKEGTSFDAPVFLPCGNKPYAAVFDVDETAILNLGMQSYFASGHPYDQADWVAWEQADVGLTVPTPGALDAITRLRALGVTVIYNTDRHAAYAATTGKMLDTIGLGPAVHGEALYLRGDDNEGMRKDGRRAMISQKYCVIAMGGDQLVDLSDQFNLAGLSVAERRSLANKPTVVSLLGRGWFVMPNPVYGEAIAGGMDDIFPRDKRWAPPSAKEPR